MAPTLPRDLADLASFDRPVQTTLDQGIPLAEVAFCVVDLETTGGSPVDSQITEIGAVSYRGGERLGTFQTLVDPRVPISPFISHLTGISDRLVADQPTIDLVLPSFLEFAKGTVFVAHNAGFDFRFLNANLVRLDHEPIPGPPVCTAKLARRIVWPEVPNVKLQTLAAYFRTRVKPTHRALADAEACAEVLHGLLDLGGRLGILTLGDLREASRAQGRPHYAKIRLADHLPHAPGVYLFRGREDQVLYVGKSNDLRGRVKSYFYGDTRKKVEDLLSEVTRVQGIETAGGELEALVLEARLIAAHEPKYNRNGKTFRRYAYLKLDTAEAFPRMKTVRRITGSGTYLGPFSGGGRATLAREALEEVYRIRRCTKTMGVSTRFAACALADIGRCLAPCIGRAGPERYGDLVGDLVSSLTAPDELLGSLERRMAALAEQERFEEAGLVRDRLRVLASALRAARTDAWLVGAGELEVTAPGGRRLRLHSGSLECERDPAPPAPLSLPCPRERADELSAVRTWFVANARHVRILACDHPLSESVDGGRRLARVLGTMRDAELPRPVGRNARPRRSASSMASAPT